MVAGAFFSVPKRIPSQYDHFGLQLPTKQREVEGSNSIESESNLVIESIRPTKPDQRCAADKWGCASRRAGSCAIAPFVFPDELTSLLDTMRCVRSPVTSS
jgi:hypothetical protein